MRLGVLVDLDGTLVRVGDAWDAWRSRLRADLGVEPERDDAFGAALDRALAAHGAVTLASACREALSRLGAGLPGDLHAIADDATARYAHGARLLPGATELLDAARAGGAGLAVVTDGPADMQRAVLAAAGLKERIDLAIVSGAPDVGVRKPHPKVFWLACTGLRVRPSDALMVGDALETDIRGAHRFGCATCWVATRAPLRPTTAVGETAPPAGTVVVGSTAAAVQVVREFVAA